MNTATTLFITFLLFNVVTFGLYWWDKQAARNGYRRVSEARLLQLALLGGSLGAVTAQRVLRHKTYKEPFRTRLMAIVILHVLLIPTALVFGPSLYETLRAG